MMYNNNQQANNIHLKINVTSKLGGSHLQRLTAGLLLSLLLNVLLICMVTYCGYYMITQNHELADEIDKLKEGQK